LLVPLSVVQPPGTRSSVRTVAVTSLTRTQSLLAAVANCVPADPPPTFSHIPATMPKSVQLRAEVVRVLVAPAAAVMSPDAPSIPTTLERAVPGGDASVVRPVVV